MPIFSKNRKNVLFIHIPKSSGSSISSLANDLGWQESFSIRGKSLDEIKFYKSSLQHLHAKALSEIFDFNAFDTIFTVVRHPFLRFKSEYYWQRSQGITNLNVDDWVKDTFEKYYTNPYIYDNHIRPQIEFIPNNCNIKVIKIENNALNEVKDTLLELEDSFENKIPYLNLNHNRHDKKSLKDKNIEDAFEKHYNRIVAFYKDDLLAFSYEF